MSTAPEWSSAEKDMVTALWGDGLSARKIADRMGTRSRAAVLGMARRINLTPRPQQASTSGQRGRRKAALERGTRQRINRVVTEGIRLAPDVRQLRGAAWEPLLGSTPVAMLDLEPGMCKWPIGEGKPYLFCGQAAGDGTPYCETHQALSRRAE